MSENNNNSQSDNYSASQPTPEIFSDATSRFLNNNLESPTKTYSASQPEPAGNGGILKKSRKSLGNGRRVSFAATAHVRVFGNEEKAAEEEAERRRRLQEAEEAEEQRQLELFRKQFDENNDNNVDYIKDSLNEFEIKSSPLVSSTEQRSTDTMTPSKRPFTNVDQSFDVDLKVDEQPSFSSYLSPEKDMDLTGCVGNILDDLSSPVSANSRRQSQMEFTNCVGSILAQISKESSNVVVVDDTNSSQEDMEMTQTVGSLVQVAPAATGIAVTLENENSQNSDNMEMTQPIGSLIMQSETDKTKTVAASTAAPVDVSFIEDCDQPAAFNMINSMSPSKFAETRDQDSTPAPVASSQLSRIAYEASTVENVDEDKDVKMMEISERVDEESVKIAKEAIEKATKNEEMFQMFSINPQQQSQALQQQPGVLHAAAQANLKEFLNETGVRFLDNLSNMGRRETFGKPRDSQIITPSRRMYVQSVLVPETLVVEKACSECIRTIEAQRQFLQDEEGRFNHHPPLAYREFLKHPSESSERSLILQKLKTLKSVARLFARQSWYEWRKGFESNFQGELERVLSALKIEYGALESEKSKLQKSVNEQINPKLEELSKELSHLKSRYESLSRSDWEQASQLHEIVMIERQKAVELDKELAETLAQEASLRQNIENVLEQRRELQDRLTNLKHSCAQFEDCTELALTELKSTFALQEALNGWRLVQLRDDSLVWEYTRGTPTSPIQVRMTWSTSSLLVTSVLIESEQSSLATLRPASQLIQPEFTNLPRSMTSILNQLDCLVQLSRELSLIKVQCDVQLLPVVPGPLLPLLLTFFNYDAKIKFDVIIGASLNTETMSFKFLSFQSHYGQIDGEQVREAIKEDYGLKKIVNNISTFLK